MTVPAEPARSPENHQMSKITPFGLFERMVARRYLSATRSGAGVSLISAIAVAGIALGVAVIIIVMSVMTGFRQQLVEQLLGVNGHIFIQSASSRPLTDYEGLAVKLSSTDGVVSAMPVIQSYGYITARNGEAGAVIYGVRADDIRRIEQISGPGHLLEGSFDDFGEGRKGGNKIALAAGLAQKLGVAPGSIVTLISGNGAETPMGTLPFRDKDYEVGAIFKIDNYEYDEVLAYMPLEQAQLFFRRGDGVDRLEFKIDDPTKDRRLFQMEAELASAAGPGTYVLNWQDVHRSTTRALKLERTMMRLVLSLIVLVAALLILTGLVMLVKDKMSDIAVMRTIGATSGSVLRIFFLSGAAIGVVGTLIGVILGVIITLNLGTIEGTLCSTVGMCIWDPSVYIFEEAPARLQWSEVFSVAVFAILVSFLSTLYPAWRAAKLDPVEALRYE